jgi:ABC-2 type transport system permease protein
MSARRILAVARRIAQGFRRDHRSLALLIVAPLVVTGLLGWVLRDQGTASIRVAIYEPSEAAGLDRLVQLRGALSALPTDVEISIDSERANDLDELKSWVRDGRIDVGLGFPGFQFGGAPTVTVITEGADPGSDAATVGLLRGALLRMIDAANPLAPTIRHETVFLSPDADQLDVLAPVFLGLFAYFFVFILTGISFLRERIGGTLERLLATPVTRAEIVIGYSLGFGFFAVLQVLLLTTFVLSSAEVPALGPLPAFTIGLGVQSAGSPLIAFGVAVLLALGAVNLGIFLSTFARTELQILQFIPLVIVPQTLLGGVFWPVERLPDVLQAVAQVLPVTYAVDALREVMVKGADLATEAVRIDLLVLAGIALVFVVLGSATIKREVA